MRRRCVARLRSATKLVFVCKGNICRSPFAAEYAKRILPGLEIHSAGYYSVANRPSPENAIAAAAQFSPEHQGLGQDPGVLPAGISHHVPALAADPHR